MAWSWSHTNEAYATAYKHVRALPRKTLLEVLHEWAYDEREKSGKRPSFRLPAGIRRLATDTLADLVWERASEYATCDNGGWNAYICPDGCHTVPFSEKES